MHIFGTHLAISAFNLEVEEDPLDQRISSLIGCGLCFLVVFPPLAFGAVYPWAFSVIELSSFVLLLAWILGTRHRRWEHSTKTENRIPSFYLPFAVFIGLVLFQMVSMPPAVLRTISPETHALYCDTVDGYTGTPGIRHSAFIRLDRATRRKGSMALELAEDREPEEKVEGKESALQNGQSRGPLHDWRSLSVYRYATQAALLRILAYAAAFLLILSWVDGSSKLLRLLYLVVLMGGLLSIIGMVQRFFGAEKIYGVWKPLYRGDQSFFGPYVNPNHFAGYVAMVIPIAVVLFLRQTERIDVGGPSSLGKYLRWLKEPDGYVALFLLFILTVMVSGLFLSLSRGGIFAFAGSMIFLFTALSMRGQGRWMLGFGLLGAVFVALFAFWLGFLPFETSMKTFAGLFQDSNVQFRLQVWSDAWRMLRDFPLFGTGLGTFAHIYPKYKTVLSQATVIYPENDFLQILVEMGFVGFGVVIWFSVRFIKAFLIRWRSYDTYVARINSKVMVGLAAAMVAILIHGFGDFNLHIPANALLFAMIMGLAMTVKGEGIGVEGQ